MSTTDPTAETLPNPYAFTVGSGKVVTYGMDGQLVRKRYKATITAKLPDGTETWDLLDAAEFRTKEEADTHAALILSALHQAVME